MAVLRLTTAGLPDPSWGTSGRRTYDFPGGNANDHGTTVAVDESRGRVYVGAWEGPNSGSWTDFAVLAFKQSDGTLDTTFGQAGVATKDFNGRNDTVRDIAVAPNGDVVAVGYVAQSAGSDDVGAWRVDPNGNPVSSFGDGTGWNEFDLGNGFNDGARSVAVDKEGRIFVSVRVEGSENSTGGVLRLGSDGYPTNDFNRTDAASGPGYVLTPFGAQYGDNAGLTVDRAGEVVVVGGPTSPRSRG